MTRASFFCGFFFGVFALAVSAVPAQAIPINLSFTATDFIFGSAPEDPVSGTFVYDADSLTSPIKQLLSIDLTIAGHTYSLAEVGTESPFAGEGRIAGLVSGVIAVSSFTNDFGLGFNLQTGLQGSFTYATAATQFTFAQTVNITRSLVNEPIAVPEPSTLALFALGLIGFAGCRRYRRSN